MNAKLRLTLLLNLVVGILVVHPPARIHAATLSVSGTANIFGAGHASPPQPQGGGAGTLPPGFSFTAGPSQVLTFASVTGSVRIDFDQTPGGTNGPDGGTIYTRTDITSFGGISGITHDQRTMFMVGAFLDDTEPSDPAPARLNFRDTALTQSFGTLAPLLRQVFFIGDGLTGTGSGATQQFFVPSTATRLFLGFADSYTMSINTISGAPGFYADNDGTLTATFTIVPEPLAGLLLGIGSVIFAATFRRSRWAGEGKRRTASRRRRAARKIV